MTFAENLMQLRKLRGISQEELGDAVGVSRQTVSKWELGSTTPELEKLVALSDYFGLSLDALVGREEKEQPQPGAKIEIQNVRSWRYEYRSKREFCGLPLVHVNICDRGFAGAKGIIAIGNVATGVVAVGALSVGVLSFGAVSVGLLALGAVAFGLVSAAAIAVGLLAFGAIAIGYLAIGGCAIGIYAAGGAAAGARVAIGESAKGKLAIDTVFEGGIYKNVSAEDQRTMIAFYAQKISELCPKHAQWIAGILKAFLVGVVT